MILVVAATDISVEAFADRQVERVTTVADAAAALDENAADAVVLDGGPTEVAELVDRVRAGEFGAPRVPVVLAVPELDVRELPLLAFDRTPEPGSPSELRRAIEDALGVADYQRTLRSYYDECRKRAERGVTDPLDESTSLRELRAEADERLSALLTDPRVVADLSWTPPDDGEFAARDAGAFERALGTDEG